MLLTSLLGSQCPLFDFNYIIPRFPRISLSLAFPITDPIVDQPSHIDVADYALPIDRYIPTTTPTQMSFQY